MTMESNEAASAFVAIAISELSPIHSRVPPVSKPAVMRVLPHLFFFSAAAKNRRKIDALEKNKNATRKVTSV